jgi:hypothetical protein
MAVVCMKKWGWAHELSQTQTQVAFATGASRGCTKVLVVVVMLEVVEMVGSTVEVVEVGVGT